MSPPFHATLEEGEAVLRFPYDERLRTLLRAIPGRRWDPQERAWCVPLEPEPAEALARLLAELPRPEVSEALAHAIERRRRKRRRGECVVERVRPDAGWWLGFATDGDAELLEALMEHPDAYGLPVIGRAQIPLDELAVRMVGELNTRFPSLRLSEDARLALVALREQARREAGAGPRGADGQGSEAGGSWSGAADRRMENRGAAPPAIADRGMTESAAAIGGASGGGSRRWHLASTRWTRSRCAATAAAGSGSCSPPCTPRWRACSPSGLACAGARAPRGRTRLRRCRTTRRRSPSCSTSWRPGASTRA